MKTRILTILCATLCALQTLASYTVTVPTGISTIANHLNNGGNGLDTVFGSLPPGVRIYIWNCTNWTSYIFDPDDLVWVPAGGTLSPGQGAYIENPGSPFNVTFNGAPATPVQPPPLPCGCGQFNFVSSQSANVAAWQTLVGAPPGNGAQFIRYDVAAQDWVTNAFNNCAWANGIPSANIGESVGLYVPCATNPCPCVAPPPGMADWWTFDESSGVVANDRQSFNNAGVYFGGPIQSGGAVANALCFATTNDFVVVSNHAEINFSGNCTSGAESFTIDAWIRPTASTAGLETILDKRANAGGTWGYSLFLSNGRLGCQIADGTFANYISPGPDLRDGQWHFVAWTLQRCNGTNGNIGILFVDGNIVYNFSDPRTGDLNNGANLQIGQRDPAFGENHYTGCIDELEFFKRALPVSELTGIYSAGSAGKCKTSTNCCDNCTAPYPICYTNTIQPGMNFIANHLCHATNATLDTLLPNVPDGTILYKWNYAAQAYGPILTYDSSFPGWVDENFNPATATLAPGEGFALYNPGAAYSLVICGCQPNCPPPCLPLTNGFVLVGRLGVGTATWDDLSSCPPRCGTELQVWTGSSFFTYTYLNTGWTPSAPVLAVGQPAFVRWVTNAACSPVVSTNDCCSPCTNTVCITNIIQPGIESYLANNLCMGTNTTLSELFPNPPPGTSVKLYNCGYSEYVFDDIDLVWLPNDPTLSPGEGFVITIPAGNPSFTWIRCGCIPACPPPCLPNTNCCVLVGKHGPGIGFWNDLSSCPPVCGTEVQVWTGTGFTTHTYTLSGWTPSAPVLPEGHAAWVCKNPSVNCTNNPVSTNDCCSPCTNATVCITNVIQPGVDSYLANNLCMGTNTTLSELFPNPPPGTSVKLYNCGYTVFAFDEFDLIWTPFDPTLVPGQGFVINIPAGNTPFTWIRCGCIPDCPPPCRPNTNCCVLVGKHGPGIGLWNDLSSCPPVCGTEVQVWTGTGFTTHTYTLSGWTPSAPVLPEGHAAWVCKNPNVNCDPCTNNLVVNGSFETPVVSLNNAGFPASVPGWSATDRFGNPAGFELWNGTFGASAPQDGQQYLEINSSDYDMTVSQVITNVSTNCPATFCFWYVGRPGYADNTFVAEVVGSGMAPVTNNPAVYTGSNSWQQYCVTFVPLSSTITLRFTGASGTTPAGAHIDNVSLVQCCTNTPCNQPLIVNCPTNKTVSCDAAWNFNTPSATNACCGTNITITELLSATNGVCPKIFQRIWQITDCLNHTATCTQTVTVVDTAPPTITVCFTNRIKVGGVTDDFTGPEPTSASAGLITRLNNAGVANFKGFDDCAVNRYFAHTFANLPGCITEAHLTVRVRACGGSGNDSIGLSFTGPGGTLVPGAGTWGRYFGDGNPVVGLTNVAWANNATMILNLDLANLPNADGSFTNLLPYLNANGFIDLTVQDDTSVDYAILDVTSCCCNTNVTVDCDSEWGFKAPVVSDNCCTNPTVTLSVSTNGLCPKVVSWIWIATDCCGNSNYCGRNVFIEDHTKPVINCATDKTVECGSAWNFNLPTASDDCCANVTVSLISSNLISSTACQEVYRGIWQAADCCNNTATCTQLVTVVDTTPPVITCANNKTVQCLTGWSFDAPSAFDACCGNVTVSLLSSNMISFTPPCQYVFRGVWQAVDCCTNVSTCTQTVTVVDTTPPVFATDCVTNVYSAGGNTSFVTPSPSFPRPELLARLQQAYSVTSTRGFDDCGLNKWFAHSFTNLPKCIAAAYLEIRLKPCGDICGNDAMHLWFTGSANNNAVFGQYFGGGNPRPGLATNDWCSYANNPQTFILDLSALPASGGGAANILPLLEANGFLDVTTQDDTGVDYVKLTVVSCCGIANKTVECGSLWFFDTPTATDNCCTNPTVTVLSTVSNGVCPKVITRTWRAMDCCNNVATISQTVTVVDTTPPVVNCPSGFTRYTCSNSMVLKYTVTAKDACSGTLPVTCNPPSGYNFPVGTTIVTCTATDACGNVGTCTFPVTIVNQSITTTKLLGIDDCFKKPNDNAPKSGQLLAAHPGANWKKFDGKAVNRPFGVSFMGLPKNLTCATLEIRMKPNCTDIPSNDGIGIGLNTNLTTAWSSYIGGGNPSPGLTANVWCDVGNCGQTFTLNLASMPNGGANLLPTINALNQLDIFVQDDTAVDYAKLTYCHCRTRHWWKGWEWDVNNADLTFSDRFTQVAPMPGHTNYSVSLTPGATRGMLVGLSPLALGSVSNASLTATAQVTGDPANASSAIKLTGDGNGNVNLSLASLSPGVTQVKVIRSLNGAVVSSITVPATNGPNPIIIMHDGVELRAITATETRLIEGRDGVMITVSLAGPFNTRECPMCPPMLADQITVLVDPFLEVNSIYTGQQLFTGLTLTAENLDGFELGETAMLVGDGWASITGNGDGYQGDDQLTVTRQDAATSTNRMDIRIHLPVTNAVSFNLSAFQNAGANGFIDIEVLGIGSSGQDGVEAFNLGSSGQDGIANLGSSGNDGVDFCKINNLGTNGADGVSVYNIGSSGQDGVSFANLGSSGQDGVSIGATLSQTNDGWNLGTDFSTLGSNLGLYRVYNHGVQVASITFTGQPHVPVLPATVNVADSTGTPTWFLEWASDGIAIQINGTNYVGNELRVSPVVVDLPLGKIRVANIGSSGQDGVSIAAVLTPAPYRRMLTPEDEGEELSIEWTGPAGAAVESAPAITGPWTLVPNQGGRSAIAPSPQGTNAPPAQLFRVKSN